HKKLNSFPTRRSSDLEKKEKNVLKELQLDLLGNYQLKNLPTVLKALDIIIKNGWKITEQDTFDGLKSILPLTGLRGRWQILGNRSEEHTSELQSRENL